MKFFRQLVLSAACVAVFLPALALSGQSSAVVRPAPAFAVEGLNGGIKAIATFPRQPVILIIAPSPKSRSFRKQLAEAERLYRQYAARDALFVAAFTKETGEVRSDIPFLYARNPQIVAADYGLEKDGFTLAIIGPDRNVDLLTRERTSAEVLRDVLDNSFSRQSVRRK